MALVRVLVVDDEAAIRVLVERVLSREGYWVQTAPNAREAGALILYDLPSVPDLAILDLNLPGVGGLELAGDLRRHFPSIRLLFMTGGQAEDALPGAQVLLKPFDAARLLSIVAAVLGSARHEPQPQS